MFGEACKILERKLQEQDKTLNASDLVREVVSEQEQFNLDLVQQALWSMIESGRVKVDGKFEVSLPAALDIT